jgi:hypothetical protein
MPDPVYDPNDAIPLDPLTIAWPSGNAWQDAGGDQGLNWWHWNEIPALKPDLEETSSNPNCLNYRILAQHSEEWVPEMSGWSVEYDDQGLASCTQSWIAPAAARVSLTSDVPNLTSPLVPLSMATRQLLSWNRELYSTLTHFFDTEYNSADFTVLNSTGNLCMQPGKPMAQNLMVPLVPVQVELVPRVDLMDANHEKKRQSEASLTSLAVMSRVPVRDNAWDAGSTTIVRDEGNYLGTVRRQMTVIGTPNPITGVTSEVRAVRPVFPRLRSQYYQVNIQFKRDPYVNRYGIRYAHVEVKPSTRLQAMKNAPVGVIPTDTRGQPNTRAVYSRPTVDEKKTPPVQKGAAIIEHIDTGFPFRESLVEYRITYPWVSMETLLKAGPIGNPGQNTAVTSGLVNPFVLDSGMWLGSVNLRSFLGHSRGRVLFNSCDIEPATSPVTGKIGWKVTHEFIANPTMEWNQVRYNGSYDPKLDPNRPDPGDTTATQPAWRTGYVMALNKNPIYSEKYTDGGVEKTRSIYHPIWTYHYESDAVLQTTPKRYSKNYPVFPYPYRDFYKDATNTGLLYYGYVGDFEPLDKIKEEG